MKGALPRWADVVLLPVINLAIALAVAALVVALIGQSPTEVMAMLVRGAFGTERGLSYTLYYATSFIFTGLAVAVASHGGLFNIDFSSSEESAPKPPRDFQSEAAFQEVRAAYQAKVEVGEVLLLTILVLSFLFFSFLLFSL